DNDVAGTEYTLGFDSACNFAYQAIDGVIATAHALPGRIFMVETLGGDTGYLALAVAHGAGAHLALLPEYDFSDDWLGERLKAAISQEKHALVVLSEGVKAIPRFPGLIPEITGVRLRYTRLGHAQRAGMVTHRDRVFAGQCAAMAYEALRSNVQSGTIVVRGGEPQLLDYDLADEVLPPPDRALYDQINGLMT
ncbi:MAG: 6-phosphofructokinase, partial [Chloroflexota bacterium]